MSRSSGEKNFGVALLTGSQTHQENYARALAADPRCRLVALSDEPKIAPRRRELNERLARELDIPYVANLADVLRRDDVHIVSVCAEPDRRAPIIVECARAGKHLYLDKSLCPTLAGADAIVAAVRQSGVHSHMFSFITQAWARRAKQIVESGAVGELRAIHADIHFAKGRAGTATLDAPRRESYPPDPAGFQTTEAKREMDNTGVYGVSLIQWLADRPARSVFCRTANYFFAEHQLGHVEDFGLLVLNLDGDLHATVSSGRIGWTSHPAAGTSRVILVGTEGTAVCDVNRPRIEVYTDQPPWTPPPRNPADPMGFWSSTQQEVHTMPKTVWTGLHDSLSDASYFVDCVAHDRESEMNAARAAGTTEILLAGYRSAAESRVVGLPLPRGGN